MRLAAVEVGRGHRTDRGVSVLPGFVGDGRESCLLLGGPRDEQRAGSLDRDARLPRRSPAAGRCPAGRGGFPGCRAPRRSRCAGSRCSPWTCRCPRRRRRRAGRSAAGTRPSARAIAVPTTPAPMITTSATPGSGSAGAGASLAPVPRGRQHGACAVSNARHPLRRLRGADLRLHDRLDIGRPDCLVQAGRFAHP